MMPSIRRAVVLLASGAVAVLVATMLLADGADYQPWSYHYFRGDYAKVGWVYERMIAQKNDAENVFMGSSHVLNAVDDELISRRLGPGSAYNAAIATSGRNLEFVVLRDILARNRPKRLFLEVRETEERTSHFGFAVLGTVSDVIEAPVNPWWPRDTLAMLQHRFEFLLSKLSLAQPSPARGQTPQFGFIPNPDQAAREKLARDAEAMARNKRWRILPRPLGDVEFRANMIYVEQIARLCRDLGIELHFLHLPFAGAPTAPVHAAFYRSLGTLHLLPTAFLTDLQYWSDITHFNAKGAEAYSRWLADDVLRRK